MKTLISKLKEILEYLELVSQGKYPYNSAIIGKLQDIFNELPEMNSAEDMVNSCVVETNDQFLGIYIGSIIRSILALHELVRNKIKNKTFREDEAREIIEEEEKEKKKKEDEKKEKEK